MIRPEPARCPVSGCSADATSTLSTEDHQTLSRVGVEVYSTYCTEHAGQMREAAQTVRAATPRCSHPVLEKDDLCGEAATEALTRDEWRMAHEILRNSSQEYCPTHVVVVREWMGRFLAEEASRKAAVA